MNQKGFANIILIIVIVILVGAVGYFAFVKKSEPITQQPTPTPVATKTKTPAPTPTNPTANSKTYTNSQWNYSIQYPSDLAVSESDDRSGQGYGSVTNVFIIDSNVKTGHQVYISTQAEKNDQFKNGGYGISIQSYKTVSGQPQPTNCIQSTANGNEISAGTMTIAGITAQKCTVTESYNNVSVTSLVVRFYDPNTGINYQFNTADYFTVYSVPAIPKNVLDQMFASFKLLK